MEEDKKNWVEIISKVDSDNPNINKFKELIEKHSEELQEYNSHISKSINDTKLEKWSNILPQVTKITSQVLDYSRYGEIEKGDIKGKIKYLLERTKKFTLENERRKSTGYGTIGYDLVSVKPMPGPKLDILHMDFQYDNEKNKDEGVEKYLKTEKKTKQNYRKKYNKKKYF